MPKRPYSELTLNLDSRDFFGHNRFKVEKNVGDLSFKQVRELIADLLRQNFRSIEAPINLASISILLNKMLSREFHEDVDLEDYSTLCEVLQVLSERQHDERVTSTLDPKVFFVLLVKIAEKDAHDLSAYAINVLRNAHHTGLLYRQGASDFICDIHGALHNFVDLSTPEKKQSTYLTDLIYLFEVKVLRHRDSVSMLRAIRRALHSEPTDYRATTVPREVLQSPSSRLSHGVERVRNGTKTTPPCIVPAPIVTDLVDTNLGDILADNIPAAAPAPVRQPSLSEINRARRNELFAKITTALATGDVALLEGLFEEMNVTIKESPTHAIAARQPGNRLAGFVGFFAAAPQAPIAAPRTPKGSEETKDAAHLICSYLNRRLDRQAKIQLINWIQLSNAEFFSTLFSPFRTNRKELYSLIKAGGLDLIIKHIPITELANLITCLAGDGGLRLKESADSFIVVLQCLTSRIVFQPVDANLIEPIFRELIGEARRYREAKNTFNIMLGHPKVLKRIEEEEQAFFGSILPAPHL